MVFMPWGVVSASSPVNTPIGYGTAMCRCTSGTPAGNGRMTAGSTTSLTSGLGSLIMLGIPREQVYLNYEYRRSPLKPKKSVLK